MLCTAQLLGYSARGDTPSFRRELDRLKNSPELQPVRAAVTVLNRGSVQYGGRRMEILMTVRKIASICTMVSFSSHK